MVQLVNLWTFDLLKDNELDIQYAHALQHQRNSVNVAYILSSSTFRDCSLMREGQITQSYCMTFDPIYSLCSCSISMSYPCVSLLSHCLLDRFSILCYCYGFKLAFSTLRDLWLIFLAHSALLPLASRIQAKCNRIAFCMFHSSYP